MKHAFRVALRKGRCLLLVSRFNGLCGMNEGFGVRGSIFYAL